MNDWGTAVSVGGASWEGTRNWSTAGSSCRIGFELEPVDGRWPDALLIQLDVVWLTVDFSNGHLEISRVFPGNLVAGGWWEPPAPTATLTGTVELADRTVALTVAGARLEFAFPDPFAIGRFGVTLAGKGQFRRFDVDGLTPAALPEKSQTPSCDMVIDFLDEMIPCAWTDAMLEDYFRLFRRHGVGRIFWVYHGTPEEGFWDNAGLPWHANVTATLANFGKPFLAKAVEVAHRIGMPLVAVYKPFEGGLFGQEPREWLDRGKFAILGGRFAWGLNFAAEHPEYCFRHVPVTSVGAPRTLMVTHAGKRFAAEPEWTLYRSVDNRRYEPCAVRPVRRGANGWAFDLGAVPAPYWAVAASAPGVTNDAEYLIRLYDAADRPVPATLGVTPYRVRDLGHNHLEQHIAPAQDFRSTGFVYDYRPGVPSAVFAASAGKLALLTLGGATPAIGIAVGVNDRVPGALYPGVAAVREYWLASVRRMLDFGVDAVALRLTNHNSIWDWEQYGFNDPASSGSDPAVRRRARGDAYTGFVRECAALVRRAQRKTILYIPDVGIGSAAASTMMDVEWQWRTWLAEGLADEAVFKCISEESPYTQWGRDVVAACRTRGIPVALEAFWHALAHPGKYRREMGALGYDTFHLYEAATLWRAAATGEFTELDPKLAEVTA